MRSKFDFEMTQEEVAAAIGISKTRVAQLEESALAKMRQALTLQEHYRIKKNRRSNTVGTTDVHYE